MTKKYAETLCSHLEGGRMKVVSRLSRLGVQHLVLSVGPQLLVLCACSGRADTLLKAHQAARILDSGHAARHSPGQAEARVLQTGPDSALLWHAACPRHPSISQAPLRLGRDSLGVSLPPPSSAHTAAGPFALCSCASIAAACAGEQPSLPSLPDLTLPPES